MKLTKAFVTLLALVGTPLGLMCDLGDRLVLWSWRCQRCGVRGGNLCKACDAEYRREHPPVPFRPSVFNVR